MAHFQKIQPVITSNGDTVSYFESSAGVFSRAVDSSAGVRTVSPVPSPVFSACDPMVGFSDGLSFALICVGLIASSVMFALISRAK